ncbi:CopD family protein [Hydrogenophaga sp. 5NK40-0174]|uniref:CopD family protein n=1 Tax=Hydrogenophaga sp. 5NK40-0174 TaxID=3127649 RepID=UPI00310A38E2
MVYSLMKLSHVLAIVLWIGGMAFVHFFLRPATMQLEPPERIRLLHAALRRFLNTMVPAVVVVLASGMGMMHWAFSASRSVGFDFPMPMDWSIMTALGLLMMLVFIHVRFVLFRQLSRSVNDGNWPDGANALGAIRRWVVFNLAMGVVIIGVAILIT